MKDQQFVITRNLLTHAEEKTDIDALSPAERKFHGLTKTRKHSSQKKRMDLSHVRWA